MIGVGRKGKGRGVRKEPEKKGSVEGEVRKRRGRAEPGMCSPGRGKVSSFGANVSRFLPNVSTLVGHVSSFLAASAPSVRGCRYGTVGPGTGHGRKSRSPPSASSGQATSTSSGQATSTSSGQAASTSSGQAASTSSGQAASTGSGQALGGSRDARAGVRGGGEAPPGKAGAGNDVNDSSAISACVAGTASNAGRDVVRLGSSPSAETFA